MRCIRQFPRGTKSTQGSLVSFLSSFPPYLFLFLLSFSSALAFSSLGFHLFPLLLLMPLKTATGRNKSNLLGPNHRQLQGAPTPNPWLSQGSPHFCSTLINSSPFSSPDKESLLKTNGMYSSRVCPQIFLVRNHPAPPCSPTPSSIMSCPWLTWSLKSRWYLTLHQWNRYGVSNYSGDSEKKMGWK